MSQLLSTLELDDIIKSFKVRLQIDDFMVVTITKENSYFKLNTPTLPNFLCIILVEQGSIGYAENGKSMELKKGDIYFSPIAEKFFINEISHDYVAKKILLTDKLIINSAFTYKSNDFLKSFFNHPSRRIQGQTELYQRIASEINALEELNDKNNVNYYFNEMIWHRFSIVIYELENYFKKAELPVSIESVRGDDLTMQFFTLLRQNFKEHHEVQFYADKLCITRKYLSKIIRKTMGKSTKDVINHFLIVEAKLLLRKPGITLNDVITELQFLDLPSFSKFFKKHTGKSPSSYRKDDLF
ncbi:AraC family transcriptional regulator [Flavobacterium agrisoli]|uniref:AraC family transcriptional regulator n=1 Tax=Flavobacterium agrisoli TaxID=2793066 RepID=A0A934PN32_9FLAO|nr:helix-turn-helix domain-containing protein [Flavobacterium agrisoli]MBK0370240.1 AraC family transcriptional regulator [Flavobacterium agrisoli]